jgi:hypothetical protein
VGQVELVDLDKYFHISCHEGPEGCRGKKIHAVHVAHVQINLCTKHLRLFYEGLHSYLSDLRPDNGKISSRKGKYRPLDHDPIIDLEYQTKK